jgi:putative transposase
MTKYRRKVFNQGICAYLKKVIMHIQEYYPRIKIKELNHDVDHIHILLSIPPQMSVGSVVRIIKANTARELRKKFEFIKHLYWGTDGIWSESYFVSTSGINEETIRNYIKAQGQEDAGQNIKLF